MRRGSKTAGFSLVEVLAGVTILALVVAPLVHAFVTSAGTSRKAREIRYETVAAQNVIESFRAAGIAAVVERALGGESLLPQVAASARLYVYNPATGSYDEVGPGTQKAQAEGGARYRIELEGVASGGRTFDARLTLDAEGYGEHNEEEVVNYRPMDAVYIQPDPESHPDDNPDVIAARTFASQAQIDSGTAVPFEYFLDRMERKITITVRKISGGGEDAVVSCAALFHYEAQYTYTVSDQSVSPPVVVEYTKSYSTDISSDFYSGSCPEDGGGLGLYFFFYPNSLSRSDTIEVVNRDNIPVSVVLIRQGEDDPRYRPVINLREKYISPAEPQHAQMHFNKAGYSYRYYVGHPSSDGGFSDFWYKTGYFDGVLVDSEPKNRLYGVTAEIFPAGGGFAGEPLAVMRASAAGW